MKTAKISIIIITLLIASALLSGTVSARYTAGEINAGINTSDTVYIGELNLDFSAFSNSTCNVDYMKNTDGTGSIALVNMIGSIPNDAKTGTYYPYNNTCGQISFSMCDIKELNIGKISVAPFGITTSETNPSSIPKQLGIIFYTINSNIQSSQLNGDWNSFTLKNTQTSSTSQSITNIDGGTQSLIGVADPSDKTNRSYAFKLSEQTIIPVDGSTQAEISFSINLNGLIRTISYPFTAVQNEPSITVTSGSILQGETGNAVLTGIPYTDYTVELTSTGADTPYFTTADRVVLINDHKVTATPDWTGTVIIPINVPLNTPTGSYSIMSSGGIPMSSFLVTESKKTFTFNPLPSGDFAVGDIITISGTISDEKNTVPVYLYVTGSGCGENGINLSGGKIIDGDESTFTKVYYSPSTGKWSYDWLTRGFDAMPTYTIHANLQPYGAIESTKIGGLGHKTDYTQSIVLTEPSLHATVSSKNNGVFTKGDYFYTFYLARGSPGAKAIDPTKGQIRWYIFGTNYHYTDINKNVPLFSNGTVIGKSPSSGSYGITYDRSFTNRLEPGTYYLIYQHPGTNNIFDIYPDVDNGTFSSVKDLSGSSVSMSSRQTDNAAFALKQMLESTYYDDLYVFTEFTIEEPWLKIDSIGNVAVGDSFTVSGTTNYAGSDNTTDGTDVSDTLEMSVTILEFYTSEDNTAMKMPETGGTTTPESVSPYEGTRSYKFGSISTDTWYPGTYEVTVINKNTGVKDAVTFTVGGQGTVSDSVSSTKEYDPSLTETIVSTPYPAATPKTAVPTQTATKSAGFLFVIPALFTVLIFWRR